MSQAQFIKPKKGTARVIIKTAQDDVLPTFEIDWIFSKPAAIKLMIYAMQLKEADNVN